MMKGIVGKMLLLAATGVCGLLATPAATAQEKRILICDGCSIVDMEQRAYTAAENARPPYDAIHYYVNPQNGLVGKFNVINESLGNPKLCPPTNFPTPECQGIPLVDFLTAEPLAVEFGSVVRTLRAMSIAVPTSLNSIPNNAYDFARYPQMREAAVSYVYSQAITVQYQQTIINMLAGVVGANVGEPLITVKATLPDGATFVAACDNVLKKFVYQKGTLKDRSGNSVPESSDSVTGGEGQTIIYDFTQYPNDRFDFLDWINGLGVPVTGPISSTRIKCTSTVTRSSSGETTVTVTCKSI